MRIDVISFGYKADTPPEANMLFDVRFLQNPYWVDELRPLTGREKPVQNYVLNQPLAIEFVSSLLHLLESVLPGLEKQEVPFFTIAFGCTGGQHRSTSIVEHITDELRKRFPDYMIRLWHRELDSDPLISEDFSRTSPASDSLS